jgi:tetratricopeptide (TPR) repeat protein
MERKKNQLLKHIFIMFLVLLPGYLTAQLPGCFFHETYAKGNLEGWEAQFVLMEKQNPGDVRQRTEALTARYGFIGYLMGGKQNTRAKKILDESEKILEDLLVRQPNNAKLLAIKAGFTGFRIGLTPLRAPFLGQRNVDAWEAALKLDPNEAMGWLEKGNSLFYRPAMFGGDKAEAEAAFRKAAQLLRYDGCNWISGFIQVRLYEACNANGKKSEADAILKKLQEKPGNFLWVNAL